MSNDQILLRIHHYRYDVKFGTLALAPLAEDITISPNRKFYDANLFENLSVNEDGFILRNELKVRLVSKHLAAVVPLLQRVVDANTLPEEELRLTPRYPQGITLIFPRARLAGSDEWQLNTGEDQAIALEFIARADATGKVLKIG